MIIGMLSYDAGAPIIHGVHGRMATGGADAVMRVLVPLGGALVGLGGSAIGGCFNASGGGVGCGVVVLTGLGIGFLTPVVLDAAVLAYEPAKASPPTSALLCHQGLTLAPLTALKHDKDGNVRPVLGLAATF